MAGLGFAPEPSVSPSPGAAPRAPQLDVLGENAARRPGVLAGANPLQKVGALLQNFSRGMNGQTLYTDELKKQRAEQEGLELERLNVGSTALTKGMELLKNTPAAQREAVAKQFGAMYEHILPGFTDTLVTSSQQPEATAAQLEALGEHAQTLIAVGGSMEGALKLAQKPEFMKQLNETADARNAPEIVQALERGAETLMSTPEGKALWDEATRDGLSVADLQDPALRDGLGLTQSHVNSIMRNKEIQSTLRPFGFVPTSDADAKAKAEAGWKPLDRVRAEAEAGRASIDRIAAEAAAKEAEKIVPFMAADGTLIRRRQGDADALAAQGFSPMITGRTPDDTTAAAKAQEKDAAGKTVPVDPYFARITGVDPNMTKQEAIDAGLVPDMDPTTTRGLQAAESGTRNLTGIVGRMREIVKNNPEANTRIAALGGIVTNIRSELDALGKATGVKIDIDRELKGREDIFKSNGIDNALMKQLAISLAYMNAKSLDETGRLSDSDVRNSAKAIGASAADPEILLALIDEAEMTADDSFRNRVQSVTGARRESGLPDIKAAEDINRRVNAGEKITPEELNALPMRARRHIKALRSAGAK